MLETLQQIYFDLCDLLDGEEIDGITLEDNLAYSTLREMLEDHKEMLAPYTDGDE